MTALITQILGYVSLMLGYVQQVSQFSQWFNNALRAGGAPTAEGSLMQEWFTTYNVVNASAALLANGTYGLAAAHTERQAILAAIAALPAGSSLPTTGDVAAGAWATIDPNSGSLNLTYGQEQLAAYGLVDLMNELGGLPSGTSPWFIVRGEMAVGATYPVLSFPPDLDWSTLLPSDTVLSWLTRTRPDFTWSDDGAGNRVSGRYNAGGPGPWPEWTFKLTQAEFAAMQNTLVPQRPIWPGLAGVALGTPVALADGLVVAGPLHGVLVDCSTIPPGASSWNLGGMPAYYRWGEVSFVTDNGEAEEFQYLGFGLGVYCPTAMVLADSAIFRVQRLPTATVTPWLMV